MSSCEHQKLYYIKFLCPHKKAIYNFSMDWKVQSRANIKLCKTPMETFQMIHHSYSNEVIQGVLSSTQK